MTALVLLSPPQATPTPTPIPVAVAPTEPEENGRNWPWALIIAGLAGFGAFIWQKHRQQQELEEPGLDEPGPEPAG